MNRIKFFYILLIVFAIGTRAYSQEVKDVYITSSIGAADMSLYLCNSIGAADVSLYFTNSIGAADKSIYFTKNKG